MASSKATEQRIKQLFLEFVRSLDPGGGPATPGSGVPRLTFYTEELGGLSLWGDSAERHQTTVDNILAILPDRADWSQREVEKLLERAVLATLDIRDREPLSTAKDRSHREGDALAKSLLQPPRPWAMMIPVVGFSTKHLPRKLGQIRFSAATPTTPKAFLASRGRAHLWSDPFEKDLPAEFAVGSLTVLANTSPAAVAKARRSVAQTLDTLNFFADLLHPRSWKVRVGMLEELPGHHPLAVGFDPQDKAAHINFSSNEFLFPLEVPGVSTALARHYGLTRCDRMLAKANPTEHEQRLIAAITWAGRATVETRREVSFLHYAISLETLAVARKLSDSLVREISMRTALLVHKDPTKRSAAVEEVKKLYDIRSKIAHSGSLQVTDTDLGKIRWYAKQATVNALTSTELKDIQTNADFETWMTQNLLGHRWKPLRSRRKSAAGEGGSSP
jgi:hypothetical protein